MVEKKEFVVKDEQAFRLKIRHWNAKNPSNLKSVEFVQECMKDGEVDFESTYHFLMTNDELKALAKGLESIVNE
jgi:hypothetical protein